jgi:flagellar basal-body rod modification protein FlgD
MSTIQTIPALASYYEVPQEASTMGTTELGQDAFLRLLTTQLQYQDPENPLQNEDFVAQLAQFATVEQLTSSNDLLEGVYAAIAAMNNASMASLVGSGVIARGNEFYYDASGSKDLYFNAPSEVQSATLTVYNEAGAVVFTGNLGSLPEGESITNWDGRDSNGSPMPEGTYTFKVTGLDAEGNVIDIEERITGTITEMDYSSGTPMPSVDGITMSIGDILTLTAGTP